MSYRDVVVDAVKKYRARFKSEPLICSCAPGRVNLIGEHIDYNDGFVLPMALPLVTIIVGAKNGTNQCHVFTMSEHVDEPRNISFMLPSHGQSLSPGKPLWANYVKGVMANYNGELYGYNAVVATSVPVGGGLSSSAALEVATYLFLESLGETHTDQSLEEKAKACQKAEHDFSNMPCGIMDQFISFMGKENCAMLLDCRSLKYSLIPFDNSNISILITNTNVRHELASSEYAVRRKQCEEAVKIIGKSSLRDVSLEELEACESQMNGVVFRRAKHVVSEILRTLQSAEALKKDDFREFGSLMTQSHMSLKNDYEVSCKELDDVVAIALECNYVHGSRMTGGGFGGCTVTLLNTSAVPGVIDAIKEKYMGEPSFYICRPSNGAQLLQI